MKSRHIFALAAVLFLATLVAAQQQQQQPGEFSEDPYLQYRPPFVRSLPVQILLTGVVITLTVVLFIHLMFTAQYHWPLAPVNYVLQISGVTTLLISLIATIHVVLSTSWSESENWPYMLSYIAVNVPPLEFQDQTEVWSIAEKATWLVMTASTSGLIQITHIQFLTLLYPSRLEKQLIFALLGPMAIVAAVMQLIPINSNTNVTSVSTAVRNVCNATLSLLFTVALFIWGLLVNRKQAWRTDGGTAAFGCGALILALVSTTLNLIYVHRQDEYVWLPGLMWAVVLWQSFLGWWWWVGAGSGSGLGDNEDMEEKLRREAKRETRRREARARRQETRKRAKKVWRDVTGAFARELQQDSSSDVVVAVTAAGTAGQSSSAQSRPGSSIAASRIRTRLSPERRPSSSRSRSRSRSRRRPTTSDSPPTSPVRSVVSSSSISSSSGTSLGTLPRLLPATFHRFYASVRRAHLLAAQKQAAERVERIREMERNGVPDTSRSGWGVSNLVWRTRSGRAAAAAAVSKGREPDTDVEGGETGGGGEYEMYERNEWRRRERSSRNRREDEEGTVAADQVASEDEEEEEVQEVETRPSSREIRRQEQEQRRADVDVDGDGDGDRVDTSNDILPTTQNRPIPEEDNRPKSFWWWGPLGRWRLQDSTTYS